MGGTEKLAEGPVQMQIDTTELRILDGLHSVIFETGTRQNTTAGVTAAIFAIPDPRLPVAFEGALVIEPLRDSVVVTAVGRVHPLGEDDSRAHLSVTEDMSHRRNRQCPRGLHERLQMSKSSPWRMLIGVCFRWSDSGSELI
jgi:hypothetical protein